MRLAARCFGSGTGVACGDVTTNEAAKTRPIEVTGDQLKGLGLAKVASGRRVVALAEDLGLDRIVVGDIHEAVEEHEAIAEAEAYELLLDAAVSWDAGS